MEPAPAPAPVTRHKLTSNGKLFIGEPPSKRAAAAAASSAGPSHPGFPSPLLQNERESPKFADDLARLTQAVQQSLPETVRRVVRDNWQKSLLGSDFHQAFIINASIHHSVPSITRRAIRDFGARMVADCKEEIIKHFTGPLLDSVADHVLAIASDDFLDKCLAARLQTIDANPLINALAKAERLGFEQGDIVEQAVPKERVIPQQPFPLVHSPAGSGSGLAPVAGMTAAAPPSTAPPAVASWSPPPAAENHPAPPTANNSLQCPVCGRQFALQSALEHHTTRKVCRRITAAPEKFKFYCKHCGQGFGAITGLQYHTAGKVCGDFGPDDGQQKHVPGGSHMAQTGLAPSGAPSASTPPRQLASNYKTPKSSSSVPASEPYSAYIVTEATGPYAHLTQQQIEALNVELREAEVLFAQRFRDAEAIADERERRSRIDGLKNSFGTKQSMIRKKYGVRLRERRTKAEIEAERERMGLNGGPRASMGTAPVPVPASAPAPPMTQTPVPVPQPADLATPRVASSGGSGWTAANIPSTQDGREAKRRRTESNGNYTTTQADHPPDDTPSRMAATALSLSEASRPSHVYHQAGARVEIHNPARQDDSARERAARRSESRTASNEPDAPLIIDADSDSTDSSDNEDIPAVLPAHVRQSLASSSSKAAIA